MKSNSYFLVSFNIKNTFLTQDILHQRSDLLQGSQVSPRSTCASFKAALVPHQLSLAVSVLPFSFLFSLFSCHSAHPFAFLVTCWSLSLQPQFSRQLLPAGRPWAAPCRCCWLPDSSPPSLILAFHISSCPSLLRAGPSMACPQCCHRSSPFHVPSSGQALQSLLGAPFPISWQTNVALSVLQRGKGYSCSGDDRFPWRGD